MFAKGASALSLVSTFAACGSERPGQPSAGAPVATAPVSAGVEARQTAAASPDSPAEMILVEGGTFRMGSDEMPDESPEHRVAINSFWIDRHELTVGEFARFVEATNYRTEAEQFGWSGVFDSATGRWERRDGASWRHARAIREWKSIAAP